MAKSLSVVNVITTLKAILEGLRLADGFRRGTVRPRGAFVKERRV
jgi:hypothetical protein